MKITDVETILLTCPLPPEHQWRTARFRVVYAHSVIVRVRTDAGLVGLGESSPYGGPARIKEYLDRQVRPQLIGQDPSAIDALTPASGDHFRALCLSGVNQALWDIAGQVAGLPVYRLLARDGEAVPEIEAYASGGVDYVWWDRPESLIQEALDWQSQGYRTMKLRLGSDWAMDQVQPERFLRLMDQLMAALGPGGMRIAVDGNMRLRSVEESIEVGRALQRLGVVWYEEPYPIRNPADYARIASELDVPLTGLEGAASWEAVKPYIEANAVDIVQTDTNVTGLSENLRIARAAGRTGRKLMPHNWHNALTTAANAHLVAAIPNRWLLEFNMTWNPLKEEILDRPLVPVRGRIRMPERPGLGVTLNESALGKFPFVDKPYHVALEKPLEKQP
ncbi:MAG: mandelate racemase/muconate lactonizing enzyme family protein [Planctomycetes bacterium]|nr:mandelate racemase/muconate lactonizing enzyme family protein [Planctomycetota bacterium]